MSSDRPIAEVSVGDLVTARMDRARVFERFGIDYCCGGKTTLREACAERQIALDDVLQALGENDRQSAQETVDWTARPLRELMDHIILTHHAYLVEELPRLSALVEKVRNVHSENHPELNGVVRTYQALKTELDAHMRKEEDAVFPAIRALETGDSATGNGNANDAAIHMLETEHDAAGEALATLRTLTKDFRPPEDACNSYRAMLQGLEQLEWDVHQHIHKENNILFPRTRELAASIHTQT